MNKNQIQNGIIDLCKQNDMPEVNGARVYFLHRTEIAKCIQFVCRIVKLETST